MLKLNPYELYLIYQILRYIDGDDFFELDSQDFLLISKLRDKLEDYLYSVNGDEV